MVSAWSVNEPPNRHEEVVEVSVEDVLFRSEDGLFAVIRAVRTRDSAEAADVTAVGNLGNVSVGETLRLRGRFSDHPRFGRRFQVNGFTPVLPTTAPGIVRYLGSGLIGGIGKGLAERLVQHFGDETIDIITQQSKRLREVPGIGAGRATSIAKAVREKHALVETMVFLRGLGIGQAAADRVMRRYQDDAVRQVREDPYMVAEEVSGIGFRTADQIGRGLGIAEDDPRRAAGATLHLLGKAADDGHLFLTRDQLLQGCTLLRVPTDAVEAALPTLFLRGLVIEDEGEGWEISVMLVGTGVDPGLERVVSYLGEFQLPVSVVTFEVFALPSGEQLLLRDVIEEQVAAPTGSSKAKSLEDVRRQAVTHGVATEFDRVIAAAEAAGLFVRPYVKSVMITPPNHRNRFLMVVTPRSGGRLFTAFGPDAFDEFFGDLTAQDVTDALGDDTDAVLSGEALVARVGAIEAFLAELPIPQAASTDGATANAEAVKAIVSLVEPGEWTTYGDVSTVAISRASAAQTVGNIARTVDDFPNAHRLLNKAGSVPPAWTDGHGGGPEVCRQLLESEGVTFDASGVADVDRRVPLAILRDRYRGSNAVAPSDPVIRN